jgi:hypothetical protein
MVDEQWKCSDHTPLVQTVGRIEGKLDIALQNQDEFRAAIETLTTNGVKERAAITQIRAPITWAKRVLLGTAGAVGLLILQSVFPKLIKLLAGVL